MKARASYHDLVRRDVFPLLPDNTGRVLDFGGGVGATSAALRESGRADHAVLFDQVADNALAAVDEAESLDLNNMDQLGAALDRHGPFDTVLCLDILEHLLDPWAIVQRLDAAIRPGGALIISLPNMNHISLVAPLVFSGRFEYRDQGLFDRTHIRWFTRASAEALATCSGMALQQTSINFHGRKPALINSATLGLFERFLAAQYVMRVGKSG